MAIAVVALAPVVLISSRLPYATNVVAKKTFLNQVGPIPATTLYTPPKSSDFKVSIIQKCARKLVDTADIVRDRDFATVPRNGINDSAHANTMPESHSRRTTLHAKAMAKPRLFRA